MEIEEAQQLLQENIKVMQDFEEVDILDACNRVAFEDVYASICVPTFPKSAMDGYAVFSLDTLP